MPWDSAKKCSVLTLSNSNRTVSFDGDDGEPYASVAGSGGRSTGKLYFEVKVNEDGLFDDGYSVSLGMIKNLPPADWCGDIDYADTIVINTYSTIINQGTTIEDYQGWNWDELATVINVAVDFSSGKLWFGINGSYLGNGTLGDGDPATGTYPTVTFTAGDTWYPVLNLEFLE